MTKWVEVTKLYLKLTIEDHIASNKDHKVDYDKENNCPLCFCPLYDGLQASTLDDVISEQKELMNAKTGASSTLTND